MAQWRKVVVSGSNAALNQVSASGNLVPKTTDGSTLGTAVLQFSDLYLAEGGALNWDNGDFTATQANNLLTLTGGNTRVDRLEVDSAADYLDVSTDLQVIAAADIILDPAGGQVSPASNDDAGLGEAGKAWSDLFLAEGGVINWDSSDVTLTQTGNSLALAGGSLWVGDNNVSGSTASTGSFGYLNVSGDTVIAGNLTFGDADTDTVSFGADITSHILPDVSDTYNLGSTGKRWNDLWISGSITANGGAHSLTSDTTIDIDAEGALTLDGGSITIGGDADVVVDVDASSFDLDSSGGISLDSSAGSIDINVVDGQTVSIGLNGAVETIWTPHVTAGSEKWSTINTSGNSTNAIALTATAGGVDINAGTVLALDGTGGIDIGKTADAAIDIDSIAFDLDASGAITIDSTSTIGIGINDIDQAINIGTQGERTITVGNVAGAVALAFNAGTGGIALASTSTGDITINSDDTLLLDSDGVLELNTSGGAINIGTDGVAVNTTIGNVTGTTALALNAGTGGIALASTGAGDITLTSTDTVLADSAGVLELNSSAGAIGVGNDAVAQKISVGGDIVTRTEVELNAILVDVNAGTGGVTIDAGAASNFTTTAGDITLDAVAASVNIDGGESATNSVRIVASHNAGGIDVDAGTNGINVDSTGAITIGGSNATGVTIGKADTTVTIPGDLDINGTMTTIDTVNLRVADRFVLVASGSIRNNALGDGGLIVNTTADGSGSALFYNDIGDRWALTGEGDTGETQQVAPAKQYVVSVSQSAAPPTGNPGDFGRDSASRRGIIYIQTSDDVATSTVDGDIWIWS